MSSSENKIYWVAISRFQKFGAARLKKIAQFFPDMLTAWQASAGELIQAGIEEKLAMEFTTFKQTVDPEVEWERLTKEQVSVVDIYDERYPKMLKETYDAPALLYYKGNPERLADEFTLAIVGTRRFTPYGEQVTDNVVKELIPSGLTIVSGLAYGIDAVAHKTTVESGGRAIAVLGSGLDRENIYPSGNRFLADKITAGDGLLVSEHPLGTPPLKHHFPFRNRIIAGLSLATLVVEAPERSGALLTAKHALEYDRDIFAIPNNIYHRNAQGPNNLIKMGAKLITSGTDIIEALSLELATEWEENKKIVADSKGEAALLPFLSSDPMHVDALIKQSGLDAPAVNSTLTLMEMKGKVRNLGGLNYVLAR